MVHESTAVELAIALSGLFGMVGALSAFAVYVSQFYGTILGGLWGLMALRFHFQIWWLQAQPSFTYLCWRFPHALLWTHTVHLMNFFYTVCGLVFASIASAFVDDIGKLYKVAREPGGTPLTLALYVRFTLDLDKPTLHRNCKDTYWYPSMYPFRLSLRGQCHLYTLGPVAMFGVPPMIWGDSHMTFRNDMLATHPGYMNHVTFFCTQSGDAYWSVKMDTLPPWTQYSDAIWRFYCSIFEENIREVEMRLGEHGTCKTYQGPATRLRQMHIPSLEDLWAPYSQEERCKLRLRSGGEMGNTDAYFLCRGDAGPTV